MNYVFKTLIVELLMLWDRVISDNMLNFAQNIKTCKMFCYIRSAKFVNS